MSQHGYPERLSGRSKVLQEDGICQPTIELLVESLTGSAFQMTVSPHDTVYLIKTKIFRVEGIPVSQQHLLYNFKELDDSASLNDYSIKDGCTLKLVLSIKGGPISTRRLPLPSDDDIQWRDIRDFVENNRDEALEWLPPGCKVLVFRDGDNVNLVKVIEEEDEVESYSPLSDYSFSEETAVTMCKMIDLRCKMENLSMKRNKKKHIVSKDKDVKKKSPLPLKKTLSEETLSSTINGLFDETPNFTKYKASRYNSNDSHPSSVSSYSTIFHSDTSYGKFANKSPLNDKYGHWPPIGSYSDLASNDNTVSSAGRAWHTTNVNYPSRETATPADYLIRPANILCNDNGERFNNGSILTSTSNTLPSYMNGNVNIESGDIDAFHESGSSKSMFLGERSLIPGDVIEANGNGGASAVPLVIESSPALGPLQLPTSSSTQRSMLLTHTTNTGRSVHSEYRLGRLLGDETESTPERYDSRAQYYYHQPGTGAAHVKRLPRSVVFGSNSHLNSLQETKVNKDIDKMKGGEKPVTGPSLGSEPQLNRLQDLQEEKVSKKNSILSHSVSNLYLNSSNSNAKLYAPHGEFSSYSELDKSEDLKLRRTSAVKPGNMIFSSSTSDLLNLKRNRILPSLSRHRNCEHLDVSDECLDKVDIIKHENLHYRPENEMLLDDAAYGSKSKNSCETCSSSTEKMFTGRNLSNTYSDGQFRRTAEMGRMNSERADNSHSIHNIQLVQNEDSSDRPFNNVSLKNLEVGSERRCRRVKKIPKIDHNNFQDHKNRADSVTRRQFMVGCGQGYEAVIQKMSNCRVRIRDKFDGKNASERDQFTPLYKRCDTRNSGYSGSYLETRNFNALDEFNSIRPKQMNEHRASTLVIDPVDSKIINSTDLSDAKEHHDNLPPLIVANRDLFELKEVESKKTGRMRCAMCKKRLSIATVHTCRCGVVFCAPHRYAEIHGCRYDYKAEGQEYLRRANPLVSAPKLPKI